MLRDVGVRGWVDRSGAQRFETMTTWTLAACFLAFPLMAFGLVEASDDPAARSYVVATAVVSAVAGWSFIRNIGAYRGTAPIRWVELSVAVAGVVALTVFVLVLYPTGSGSALINALAITTSIVIALLVPIVSVRTLTTVGLGLSLLAGAVAAVAADVPIGVATVLRVLSIGVFVVIAMRSSLWMMGIVWELDERRAVAARLAIAEERLRFSRDLHDVYGRTLSTVSVKSELAAALARRGDPEAVTEMLDVRRIANEALREVRAIVQGYRTVSLAAELDGARSILRAAGIDVRVAGEELVLPDGAAAALAWAVREGVTNVVRHSAATWCVLTIRVDGPAATLEIRNDRAGRPSARAGSGLRGLTERLEHLDGIVRVERVEDEFVLVASVPLDTPAPTVPEEVRRESDQGAAR